MTGEAISVGGDGMTKDIVLVAGGGGFIGGHLVSDLVQRGCACAPST